MGSGGKHGHEILGDKSLQKVFLHATFLWFHTIVDSDMTSMFIRETLVSKMFLKLNCRPEHINTVLSRLC